MKKKLIFLCEYPFTKHTSFKMEIEELRKKKLNIEINDFSEVIYGKRFSNQWKTKIENKTLKFKSLLSWINYFRKIDKEKTIFWNNIRTFNFNSFVIELILRLSNAKIILHHFYDVFSYPQKKTLKFIAERIFYYKFNIGPYIFFFKVKFLRFILNLFPFRKVYFLSNNFKYNKIIDTNMKNSKKIDFNSYDYSNYVLFRGNTRFKNRKYAIYLDGGGPYFSGDRLLNNAKRLEYDNQGYYGTLNIFFKKLEDHFNIDILIIPHPKYKSNKNKSLNPFFDKNKVINEYDSLPRLSDNCLFFINYNSTSQSFAVASYKPTILFYLSKYYIEAPSLKLSREILARKLNIKPIDICNFKIEDIKKNLKINKKKYDLYKYDFLTPKNKSIENISNSQIITNLMKRI